VSGVVNCVDEVSCTGNLCVVDEGYQTSVVHCRGVSWCTDVGVLTGHVRFHYPLHYNIL